MELKDYVAILAVIVSLVAIYMSWKNAQAQGALTERLKGQDIALDRKKLVTALWDKMSNLWEVVPDDKGEYNETFVWENLNSLELIAVCFDNNIVDQRIVYLVSAKNFNLRVGEIRGITKPLKELRKTGLELLQERSVILRVNSKFETMLNEGGFKDEH